MQTIPYNPASDPMQYWGQALSSMFTGLEQQNQRGLLRGDLQSWQNYYDRQAAGAQPQSPQMRSQMGQQMTLQGQMQNVFRDPLQREYRKEQIKATKALTKQREEAARQALPDRMLRQADRYLRVVDDIMSEYWYTPEGPYRDKLLKDAQSAREKAIRLIEKYGATSEAGKVSLQQLEKIDEEIKKAGGKVSMPKNITASYMRPKTKEQFDKTFRSLTSPEDKQRYINQHWRPEFGRHLK